MGSSTALTLRKRVVFEGLQVELFQDIDDPVATAEGEDVMSQMRSAELQLAADSEVASVWEAFEREAVNITAQDEFESSSIGANSNRSVEPYLTLLTLPHLAWSSFIRSALDLYA